MILGNNLFKKDLVGTNTALSSPPVRIKRQISSLNFVK